MGKRKRFHWRVALGAFDRYRPRPADAHNLRRSLQELRLFRSQFPDAVITPGHDPDFYAGLEARYQ